MHTHAGGGGENEEGRGGKEMEYMCIYICVELCKERTGRAARKNKASKEIKWHINLHVATCLQALFPLTIQIYKDQAGTNLYAHKKIKPSLSIYPFPLLPSFD
jgi:hypothetical protein